MPVSRFRRARSVTTCLLETLPPIFHLFLLTSLTFYSFYFNPSHALWHLATLFIVGQIVANWVQFLLNRAIILASPKNFPGYVHRFPSLTSSRDPRTMSDEWELLRSDWKECESCDMHVPLRTHHCGHCRRCIYALDHHCYFLGHCVGRTNMRFFIVFCFYACVGCALGVYNMVDVMLFYRSLYNSEFLYYLLPFTLVRYFMNQAMAFEILYVALINFGLGACGATAFLFCCGMWSAFTGKTPHDEKKKKQAKPVIRWGERSEEDIHPMEHFESVFGPYGLLHFLVPVVPFEKPKIELGFRRIITYNNDYIVDGNIHTSPTNLDFRP